MDFADLGLDAKILKAAADLGWTEPTPIQAEAVPVGLRGEDIMAQAQTGTGKTAAYGMTILGRTPSRMKAPSALVLCPTRELAAQVGQELFRLSRYTGHRYAAIYGGARYDTQIRELKRGVDIVVGTPGRVKDLIEKEALDVSSVRIAVLDEADRMLDMGFEEEVDFIMAAIPSERQTLMFSATMADGIIRMGRRFTRDPVDIRVSRDEPCSDLVSQYYIPVSRGGKLDRLETILACNFPKTVVFCQTKSMVDELSESLNADFKTGALHGDMPQNRRERVIRGFRDDRFRVLIATDVAARGIDVNNVDVVVNYDVPNDAETYLHRIGRTGRAGRNGIAISFVTKREDGRIRMYEAETGKKMKRTTVEDVAAALSGNLSQQPVRERKVVRAVVSKPPEEIKGMVAVQVNLGKEDGLGRVQIMEAVKRNANLTDDLVGRVGLGGTASYVEVEGGFADMVVRTLTGKSHNGKTIRARIAPRKVPYAERAAVREKVAAAPNGDVQGTE